LLQALGPEKQGKASLQPARRRIFACAGVIFTAEKPLQSLMIDAAIEGFLKKQSGHLKKKEHRIRGSHPKSDTHEAELFYGECNSTHLHKAKKLSAVKINPAKVYPHQRDTSNA
jgi:hypothetical protein